MRELIDKIRNYLSFSQKEIQGIVISSLIIALVFSLKSWTGTTVGDFIAAVLIALLSVSFHVLVQKIAALHVGFTADFKIWWNGLIISLILMFVTRGLTWWILVPGGISFSMIAKHRLGKFRYGMNYLPMGIVAFAGPIASIVLGTIFKNIELYLPFVPISPIILHNIFIFNLILAVCTMLPIPPLDGHYLFYASRTWYVFLFSTILIYTILTAVLEIYSWIVALVAGFILLFIYYISFEKGAWHA
ncbi:hypothetical protein GF336_05565 [Candidatus Woesearchaeota archaeon]|nr:hypothetical protein [Candidatus Woesearchaeota archaeon]